ncbi:MAG: HAD family hydrolase, partial [Clostridium sp.]|nr:HAD family hydrolase [Clostridium sp.]
TQNSIITELKNDPSVYRISAKSAAHSYYFGKSTNDYDTPYNFPTDCTECFNTIAFRSLNPERILNLLEQASSVRYYRVTGEELVDILPVSATKWNAIRLLAKEWSIDLSEIAAFGDDYNDIEMLKNCGVGVAVANALDEVKAVANYICDSNDEDGVARWLESNITRVVL